MSSKLFLKLSYNLSHTLSYALSCYLSNPLLIYFGFKVFILTQGRNLNKFFLHKIRKAFALLIVTALSSVNLFLAAKKQL